MKLKNFYLLFIIFFGINTAYSQSNLLESVKKNPDNAIEICEKFEQYNSQNISANSDEAVNYVSQKNQLSAINAEILSIYVIANHCPNVI